jgi:hypothetical protein
MVSSGERATGEHSVEFEDGVSALTGTIAIASNSDPLTTRPPSESQHTDVT